MPTKNNNRKKWGVKPWRGRFHPNPWTDVHLGMFDSYQEALVAEQEALESWGYPVKRYPTKSHAG